MIPIVSFNDLAEAELNETADFYEFHVKGLGVAFLAEVERSTKLIQQKSRSISYHP